MKKGFSSKQRVRHGAHFQQIYAARQRSAGQYYVLYYRENPVGYPRLGVVVSRRNVRKAVMRNRAKRLARERFRYYQTKMGSVDLIFSAKPKAALGTKQELRQCLDGLFQPFVESYLSSSLD